MARCRVCSRSKCMAWSIQVAYGGIEKSRVGLRLGLSFRFPLTQVMVRCGVWPGGIGVWPGVGFVAGVGVWHGVSQVAYGGIEKSRVGLRLSFCFPLAQVMVRCGVGPRGIGVWPGVGFVAGVGVWHGVPIRRVEKRVSLGLCSHCSHEGNNHKQ